MTRLVRATVLVASVSVCSVSPPSLRSGHAQTAPAQGGVSTTDAKQKGRPKDDQALVLDTVTVTATKTEEPVINTLAGASVVTRKQIETLQPNRVSEILRDTPGVTSQESNNDPQQSVNIRGLQDFGRVNVLVDGARQDFQISGHNANGSFYLDPEFIGQADVVRGPVSNIYGSGAIGGVVSFRTRGIDDILNPDEKAGWVQRFGFGTNRSGFVNSTAAGVRLGTAADVFGQVVFRDSGSYRDGGGLRVQDTGSQLLGGSFKLNVRPAEGQELSATALVQNYDFINNGTSTTGTRFQSDVKTQNYTLGYRIVSPWTPLVDFSIKGYYSGTDLTQTVVKPTATYTALGVVPGRQLSDKIGTFGFDVHNTARFDTGPLRHEFTIGGDAASDHVTTTDQAGGYVSALTPGGDRILAGAFVQDQVRYGSWLRVLGALRYDSYSLSGGGFSSEGHRLSPKLTIGVTPVQGIELYGTYAEGYRAPALTETLIAGNHPFPAFTLLPNPNLRPETARNLEGGVNARYDNVFRDGDSVRAKLTVFSNTVSNYIDLTPVGPVYFVPFSPAFPVASCAAVPKPFYCVIPVQSYQYINIAKARLSGVEFEGAYDWGRGFVSVSGTHVRGTNQLNGAALATVAPDRISGTVGLRLLDSALTVASRVTFVAPSKSGTTITTPSKAYGLVDVFATYRHSDTVSADLTVTNLFDRRYTQYLNTLSSPGLTAKLGLTVKFAAR